MLKIFAISLPHAYVFWVKSERFCHLNSDCCSIMPLYSPSNELWRHDVIMWQGTTLQSLEITKSAARIILYADHLTPLATLFTKLEWIPFYGQSKINKCAIFYKRVNGSLPDYLNEQLTINNTQHNRSIRYAGYNSICPYHKRETEGGPSFTVSATRLWNNVPLNIRKSDSIKSLRTNLFKTILTAQQHLDHFRI